MKNKKKILSLIACLSLLSSCNRGTSSNSSCSITTSTPTSSVTPSKTVEELNKELFENYAVVFSNNPSTFTNFRDDIPEVYLNLETIIVPETINGVTLTSIYCGSNPLFNKFTKVKTIKLPSTISSIGTNDSSSVSSPFVNLPNLENIEVDSNNEYFSVKGNCLIRNSDNKIICGWKDVVIPEDITTIRNYAFCKDESITSITLHDKLETLTETSGSSSRTYVFTELPNLKLINSNGNTRYVSKEGSNILYDKINNKIAAAYGDVTIPDEYIDLKTLNLSYFSSVSSVNISKNITKIEINAFYLTKINSIHIPSTVIDIDENGFNYMKTLQSITVDEDSKYKIDPNTNVMYDSATNKILAAWSSVIIPDNITDISGLFYKQSVTDVKVGKNVTNIESNTFPSIDSGRDYKDFVKITIDPENTLFKMNETSLVKLNSDGSQSLISIQPNSKGEVEIPSEVKVIDQGPGFTYYSSLLKAIKFNEGLEEIKDVSNAFSDTNMITTIDLPKSIKKIGKDDTIGSCFFTHLSNIQKVTIAGENENEYFKIETGCLIQKNGFDTSDKILFGFGDVIIPESVTKLGNGVFLDNRSIKSLTIHKNIKEYEFDGSFNTFTNLYLKGNTIYFNGTLDDFKNPIGSNSSLYTYFTTKSSSGFKFNFLKDDGTYDGPYTTSQLKEM